MEHAMRLTSEPFEAIRAGNKVIESRLYDDKRQQISLGDTILFSNADQPEESVRTKVIGLLRYNTFAELFEDHSPELFAGSSRAQLLEQIQRFYSENEESEFGVLGIRIQLID